MRRRSARDSGDSSTRIGRRPCSSGSRSAGFARWNAPEAMNSMWSVFTRPYLVFTVVPSISGSRSRCTPSRETSPPRKPPSVVRAQILSISSMNTMPLFSACATASLARRSLSSSWSASSASSSLRAASTVSLRFCMGLPPIIDFIISPRLIICPGGMPGMSSWPIGLRAGSATAISISLSSNSPSRSMRRNLRRVSAAAPSPTSAVISAFLRRQFGLGLDVLARLASRSMFRLASTRSRTMLSTSRPT